MHYRRNKFWHMGSWRMLSYNGQFWRYLNLTIHLSSIILMQINKDFKRHPIGYGSWSFHSAEYIYSVTETEFLTFVQVIFPSIPVCSSLSQNYMYYLISFMFFSLSISIHPTLPFTRVPGRFVDSLPYGISTTHSSKAGILTFHTRTGLPNPQASSYIHCKTLLIGCILSQFVPSVISLLTG